MTDKITQNAQKLLEKKYFTSDEFDYSLLVDRVANYISNNDKEYNNFYNILYNIDFLPNSPILMNADTDIGYFSACNVMPIEDDMEGIFDTLKKMAIAQKHGAGVGFSFSRLRPSGDKVGTTGKYSSGPISFLYAYDEATNTVKQGGKRRGACMGILRVDHPNIMDFIKAKGEPNEKNQQIYDNMKDSLNDQQREYLKNSLLENQLSNFNLSIAITDEFMEALENDEEFELINPRNGKVWDTVDPNVIWDNIIKYAHKNGEPGLMFIDEVNRQHPAPEWIESFNVCGSSCVCRNKKIGQNR
ncbi:MAG: ribonucleotide reductase N-terminal alpha domain-containing protein [Promethearchaeota archaeon]